RVIFQRVIYDKDPAFEEEIIKDLPWLMDDSWDQEGTLSSKSESLQKLNDDITRGVYFAVDMIPLCQELGLFDLEELALDAVKDDKKFPLLKSAIAQISVKGLILPSTRKAAIHYLMGEKVTAQRLAQGLPARTVEEL